MNKTFTINLNGKVYNIDDDAYEALNSYLENLKAHFQGEEGAQEIMEDIEARIGELFTERFRYGMQVIRMSDVDDVIAIMGNPDEIDEGEAILDDEDKPRGEQQPAAEPAATEAEAPRKSKRLFRDPDDMIIAGVCSGLGAYFNLDPWIFRAIFLVTCLFGFGTPILIYVVMWIIIPESRTVAQKLQMRGEAANVENIRNAINEGETATSSHKSAAGEVLGFLFKFVAVVFGGCLGIFILLLLFTIALSMFMPTMMMYSPGMNFTFHGDLGSLNIAYYLACFLAFIVPVFKGVHLVLSHTTKVKPLSSVANWTLLVIWMIAVSVILVNVF